MENLENECEDLVDELSDMRQKYPAFCSHKLAKIFKLTKEINVLNVETNSVHFSKIEEPLELKEEGREIYENFLSNLSNQNSSSRKNLKNMCTNLDDLIKIAEQLKREEHCPINRSIKKLSQNICRN